MYLGESDPFVLVTIEDFGPAKRRLGRAALSLSQASPAQKGA